MLSLTSVTAQGLGIETSAGHRHLASTFSADNSKITVEKTALPSSKVTVKLTAYDTTNAKMTAGGVQLYARVSNECTKNDSGICVPVATATQTLKEEKNGLMKDNADGTYTYEFETETKEGKITVAIYWLNTFESIETIIFTTKDWSGTSYNRPDSPHFNLYNDEVKTITGVTSGPVSSIFRATFVCPASGDYGIIFRVKGCITIWVDGKKISEEH